MSIPLAAGIAAAAAGVLTLTLTAAFLLWKTRGKRSSDSNSSDPSLQDNQSAPTLREGSSYTSNVQGARCFKLEDLGIATNFFNASNFIGSGQFGDVYKGLLNDMTVAIKIRSAPASDEFVREVEYLSSIRHRNLVRLIGYCQESGFQMLVYEYIPNGSISSHLYGTSQESGKNLEFKHRLSIAIGAAKGLAFLHLLDPPLIHMNFKASNLLVDEDFTPKISDTGLRNILLAHNPSLKMAYGDTTSDLGKNTLNAEIQEVKEKNDMHSFGVFLLELVSGKSAIEFQFVKPRGSIIRWAQNYHGSDDISTIVDARMENQFTEEGIRDFVGLASRCLSPLETSPPQMSEVVAELDRILGRERSLTTILGEDIPSVMLGSELFTSS